MAASSQIGNFDQEFFSLFNRLYKIVDFEAFLGPVRVSPRKASKCYVSSPVAKTLVLD